MSSGPSTPEHLPPGPLPGVRRSFTVPTRLENSRPTPIPASPGSENIETLFTHSFARVVSFTAGTSSISYDRRSSLPSTNNATEGTLPWGSATERTMAAGPVKVYRVPNSVSFLNSGSLLHPILPKSQCWCVDSESKFVLRVRANNYYRIELPYDTADEQEKVEEFKSTLSKVLQFEKTPCPFRGEYVEEPLEVPKSARKQRRDPPGQAKKWKFDRRWKPEGPDGQLLDVSEISGPSTSEDDDNASVSSSVRDESPPPGHEIEADRGRSPSTRTHPAVLGIDERKKKLLANRSLTMPMPQPVLVPPPSTTVAEERPVVPQELIKASPSNEKFSHPKSPNPGSNMVALCSSPRKDSIVPETDMVAGRTDENFSPSITPRRTPSPAHEEPPTPRVAEVREHSDSSSSRQSRTLSHSTSVESFYSLDSSDNRPRSPSIVDTDSLYEDPLSELEDLQISYQPGHKRGISELTITPHVLDDSVAEETPRASCPTIRLGSEPTTPTLISDSEDSHESPSLNVPTPPDAIRLRKLTGASQRRAYSPMPHPVNLVSTVRSRSQAKQMAATIVQKTCALLLSPPSSLVELMLKIAARVAAGLGVSSYRLGRRFRMPGSWDATEADEEDDVEEDDYGIPLQTIGSRSTSVASVDRRSQSFSASND